MNNPIKEIVTFNQKAGLLDKGYDDFLESSFQIEEALEGFNIPFEVLYDDNDQPIIDATSEDKRARDVSRYIVSWVIGHDDSFRPISDVDRLDKACDAVVFAVGSMAKLNLNAQEITQALNIVMKYNNAKLGAPKDEFGKQMKPEGWTGPEPELQALLDRRVKK